MGQLLHDRTGGGRSLGPAAVACACRRIHVDRVCMNQRTVCSLLLCILIPVRAVPQASPAQPSFSVHIGVGNHYGWLGTAGEAYLLRGRVSAFAGIGITPHELSGNLPTAVAGAGGLRYYAPFKDSRHRLFADLSMSLLTLTRATMIGGPVTRDYGPAVSIGYSYVAGWGLTGTAGAGVGWASTGAVPVLQLGIGWTWRR
jgi:hypothetical protein